MTQYCQKCGKELHKDRIVGFDKRTGNAIISYSCPKFLKDKKIFMKRKAEVKGKAKEFFYSKQNKAGFFSFLFGGQKHKMTERECIQKEIDLCYKGLCFKAEYHIFGDPTIYSEHANEVELKEVPNDSKKGGSK